jgi:hypothetical protein
MGYAIVIRAERTRAELLPFDGASMEVLNGAINSDYTDIVGVGSMRGVKWLMVADSLREFKPEMPTNEWATLLRMFSGGGGNDVKGDVVLLSNTDGLASRAMSEDEARDLWAMFSARSGSFDSQLVATA